MIKTIDSYPNSYINGRILYLYLKANTLESAQAIRLKSTIDTSKMISYDLSNLNMALNSRSRLSRGAKFKSFALYNAYNTTQEINLSKNKYTLVDFWASWCGPCRQAHPELKEIYENFNNDFDIVSISLDDEKNDWISAIKKDKLIWNNLIGEKDWDSEISIYYGITSLPFNILIDKNGKIIQNNIKPSELSLFLESNTN